MHLLRTFYKNLKSTSAFLNRIKFRVSARGPLPKTTGHLSHSLPNELLLAIFSFLELKSYLTCNPVCKKWRELLPSTEMDPIRKRLLKLYYLIVNTPNFEKCFEWTNKNALPFNREEYLRSLLFQCGAIPEEFRMWILEWPARLVIRCTWPGHRFIYCWETVPFTRRHGVNWIAYRSYSPRLYSLIYQDNTPSQTSIPALLIWRAATNAEWLCFEQDDPNLFGRVFRTDSQSHTMGTLPYYPSRDDNDSGSDSSLIAFSDWIEYLESLWDDVCIALRSTNNIVRMTGASISQPVVCEFASELPYVLPAPAWDSSSTP